MLLEHKKTRSTGVYAGFATDDRGSGWQDSLHDTVGRMCALHGEILSHAADRERDHDHDRADAFVRDRMEGARACLMDLQRLGR